MKSFWKIFWWILAVYIAFHVLIGIVGAAFSLFIPIAIVYFVYRQFMKNNRLKAEKSRKKHQEETGILIYRYDWWKLIPAIVLLLPIVFFSVRGHGGWAIYLLDLVLAALSAYFISAAAKRWTSLEITNFCLARVDHRYFFRHKIIYDWSRIYYTEVQTEGLNYQLYVATLDGSFTIKQHDVKNIAIPELKKIIDSYVASGGQAPLDQAAGEQESENSGDHLDKMASYVLNNGNAALDKAKEKIDHYFNRPRANHQAISHDLSPIMIFQTEAQKHRRYGSFTAYGFELADQGEKDTQQKSRIPWQNISDIKVDDFRAPSKLELKLQLAGRQMENLLIGDKDSGEVYTSSLSIGNLYNRIQLFKAHSKHTSMTV